MRRNLLWPLLLGLLMVASLVSVAAGGHAAAGAAADVESVVTIEGALLPLYAAAPVAELGLFSFRQGGWQAIPFQVDERDASGAFVSVEDGLLDDNDVLVFMGADAGAAVAATSWITDRQAQLWPRYAITITDPLQPGQPGWAYLYRSPTLAPSDARYVTWDAAAQTATAVSYTLGFMPEQFLGIASLTLNGQGADVLDRQKVRAQGTLFLGPIPVGSVTIDEESLLDFITAPVTITLPIAGPVRALGGSEAQQVALYGRHLDVNVALEVSPQPLPGLPGTTVRIDSLRVSLDLADPAASGLAPATYFDPNVATGVPIDGGDDAVPATPPVSWRQVDGASGGLVAVTNLTLEMGDVANYYLDDDAVDPDDTGDGRSFGDAGVAVEAPSGWLTLTQSVFILPPTQGNVGADYAQRVASPPAVEVAAHYPAAPYRLWLPALLQPAALP